MSFVVFLSYPDVSYIQRLCFSRLYSAKTFLLHALQGLKRVLLCFIRSASKPSIATAWSRLLGQGPFLLATARSVTWPLREQFRLQPFETLVYALGALHLDRMKTSLPLILCVLAALEVCDEARRCPRAAVSCVRGIRVDACVDPAAPRHPCNDND